MKLLTILNRKLVIFYKIYKTNYEQYQLIHRKISQINKDYEEIKLTNNSLIETITRQEIRDDISNCTKLLKMHH